MKAASVAIAILISQVVCAQKIESIHFNLYTDSLKKGFYNYINIDGKTTDGRWLPLTSKEIKLTTSGGEFDGNDLFIDSTYSIDSVKIKAELISDPRISKEVVIYIRKRGFSEILKTEDEIINSTRKQKTKVKKGD